MTQASNEQIISNIIAKISETVIGKEQQIKLALTCILAKGHLLIEDLPGMGKTTLAHTLAITLGLEYQRTQFTNDMLPADIIGVSIFDAANTSFVLHKGPIFNQVVLADEINRASPKTQSALLEAMESGRVSIDGNTYELPTPFFVIATQNPQHHIGTYALPESQLDRFMMKISLGFPDLEAERKILSAPIDKAFDTRLSECIDAKQLLTMQQQVQEITVTSTIIDYVIALCRVTRGQQAAGQSNIALDDISPLSPRAAKALIAAAKAWAYIHNRDYVLPDDVQAVFSSVCEHRLASVNAYSVNDPSDFSSNDSINDANTISAQILSIVDVVTPLASTSVYKS